MAYPRLWSALTAAGLARPAFRAAEYLKARRFAPPPASDDDGTPIPSRLLMFRSAGHAHWPTFEDTGRRHVAQYMALAREAGVPFETASAVLEWGCGCGRLSRHVLRQTKASFHGRDIDTVAIRWNAAHLGGDFRPSLLAPPLDLDAGTIDICYAHSVFTHLGEHLQKAWLAEMARVLRPGGLFIVTFHDEHHVLVDTLGAAQADIDRHGVARTSDRLEGLNFTATYQTSAHITALAAAHFDCLNITPSTEGTFQQAVAVLRRRDA